MIGRTHQTWRILYDEAFDRFGVVALWNCRRRPAPTREQALSIATALKRQGDMAAWNLAHRLEDACRAA